MTHAFLSAYNVFRASQVALQHLTEAMRERNTTVTATPGKWRRWMVARSIAPINKAAASRGESLGRLMNLAVAATTADVSAMIAVGVCDFEMIRDAFFDRGLMAQVKSHMQFATLPAGTA